ncbi:MAG: type I-F CRISPR-associated protein Csy1 [Colwellia sp.]|nr:type I-F CRISPR-associated protein Csy1 [Colwellia sp.]
MSESAIIQFFEDKKEAWIKKNIKTTFDELQVKALKQECAHLFSPNQWLPNAAKRAGQMSRATHPCTFSHPSARKNKNGYVSSLIIEKAFTKDGFLKTGNVKAEIDALGNAAVLDVYKFLTLELSDGRELITHIQNDTNVAMNLLSIEKESYQQLKKGFMAMIETTNDNITSSKIKQVYFPVRDGYHQMSILTNSGLIYKLRERIDAIRFAEKSKTLRVLKRNKEFSKEGFIELYNLTTIGYGGTKPQNISVLNNRYGGKTHLLQSLPPCIEKRTIRFPRKNFFAESFRYRDCQDIFQALHKIFKTDYNNKKIREGRDYRLQDMMNRVIARMWAVRGVEESQYHTETNQLKAYQKIWLLKENVQQREDSDKWLDELCQEISIWVIKAYEKTLGKQALKLGDNERLKIKQIIDQNREALR